MSEHFDTESDRRRVIFINSESDALSLFSAFALFAACFSINCLIGLLMAVRLAIRSGGLRSIARSGVFRRCLSFFIRLDNLRVGLSIFPVLFRRVFRMLGNRSGLSSVSNSNALRRERFILVGDVLPSVGVFGLSVLMDSVGLSTVVVSSLAAAVRRLRVEIPGGDDSFSFSVSFCSVVSDFVSMFSVSVASAGGGGVSDSVVAAVVAGVGVGVSAVVLPTSSSLIASFTASSSSSIFSVFI